MRFDLGDVSTNASAEAKLSAHSFGQKEKSPPDPRRHRPRDLRPLQLRLRGSKDAPGVNFIFLLQHENGDDNNNMNDNNNNEGTYAAGKLNLRSKVKL